MANNNESYQLGMLASDDVRKGFISGVTFKNRPIQYVVVDGVCVFEGCIALCTLEQVEARERAVRSGAEVVGSIDIQRGVGITGAQYRWPNALVPYDIDPAMLNQSRVTNAIAHWEQRTNVRFVQRTSGNASQYPDYVHFMAGSGCWSYVGKQGASRISA